MFTLNFELKKCKILLVSWNNLPPVYFPMLEDLPKIELKPIRNFANAKKVKFLQIFKKIKNYLHFSPNWPKFPHNSHPTSKLYQDHTQCHHIYLIPCRLFAITSVTLYILSIYQRVSLSEPFLHEIFYFTNSDWKWKLTAYAAGKRYLQFSCIDV